MRRPGTRRLSVGIGCWECGGTGYRGRAALTEVIPLDEPIREAMRALDRERVRARASDRGARGLPEKALISLRSGLTSVDSSGLGEVVESHVAARGQGGRLVLTGVSRRFTQLLATVGLLGILEVQESEKAGLESLAERNGEGWGVGLPYVQRITEAHGGSVMMSSSLEDGTAFVIDIPLDARPFAKTPTAA